MNETLRRAISGAVFVAIIIASLFVTEGEVFKLLMMLAALGGYKEYLNILSCGGKPAPAEIPSMVAAFFIIGLINFGLHHDQPLWMLPVVIVMAFSVVIEILKKREEIFQRVVYGIFGHLWITIPFALLPALGHIGDNFSPWAVLGFFIILWVNDTGAYLAGKAIGRRKLAPHISPGKTIEGFFGGVLAALAMGWLMPEFTSVFAPGTWLVIALIVAVFSNAGDLFESTLKRLCGVKDSGNLLPGHGGILDRFDGVLLSVPIILAYLLIINR